MRVRFASGSCPFCVRFVFGFVSGFGSVFVFGFVFGFASGFVVRVCFVSVRFVSYLVI